MMKSRRKKRQKIRVIIYIILFLTVSVAFLNNKSNITKIERILKTIGLTTINIFNYPVDFVEQELIEIKKEKDLEKTNKELLLKIKNYELMEAELNELKYQINSLEKDIELNIIDNKKSVVANVINRNIGAWYNEITINKGEKHGVKIGDTVVTNKGLLGSVIKVTDYYASVQLITSFNINNISVKIGDEASVKFGILKKYEDGLFSIELLDSSQNITKGMLITTTGLTDNYKSGIVIGVVEVVEVDNFGLAPLVKAKSNINFNQLNYVEVIIGNE